MKTITYRTVLILIFMMQIVSASSQNKVFEKADKAFKELQYQDAIAGFLKIAEKSKEGSLIQQQAIMKVADCYSITNQQVKAIDWYGKIAETKFADRNARLYLKYADALRTQGHYRLAKIYYNKYLDKQPTDILAKVGIRSCELFTDTTKIQTRFVTKNLKSLNSLYDDYAPVPGNKEFDELIFSTNRKGTVGKDHENYTGAWFSDIMSGKLKSGDWLAPTTIDAKNLVNTVANEGAATMNKTFQTMYFTRCEQGTDRKVYCQVMKCDRFYDRWSKPVSVLSEAQVNIGQPSLSKDELTIYFSSDRKGGTGGKDIWMSSRTGINKPFKEFVNLGNEINTAGDEMFPCIKDDSILYFSSNGHPTMGGLDIFRSVKRSNKWSEPENLFSPINSTGDDFGIVFKSENQGYFSSNRKGGAGGDDLYSFDKVSVRFTLDGITKDQRTLLTLSDITISLTDQKGKTQNTVSDQQGKYNFDASKFKEDSRYQLLISGKNYFNQVDSISTLTYYQNTDFKKDYLMRPIPEEPIVLPDILYDLRKWDIKPQYQDSLRTLVKILKENPNLVIELRAHTDSRATNEYNDELSQKRAQSVVDFLVSKGTDPGRLVAKGYGKRVPRRLEKDLIKGGYPLKKGTLLDDAFVDKLPTKEIRESVYELNRRTEFTIIARDYKPQDVKSIKPLPVISLINDSLGVVVPYNLTGNGEKQIIVQVNDYTVDALIDVQSPESIISEKKVLELLRTGALSKDDFIGDSKIILDNNQVAEGSEIRIKRLRTGGKLTENVSLLVKKESGYGMKLGKDILDAMGTFEINENTKQLIIK